MRSHATQLLASIASILLQTCCHALSLPPPEYDLARDTGRHGSYPTLPHFQTSPIEAPHANFHIWNPQCDNDLHYFLSPRGWKVPKPGPMILDAGGNVIWSKHFSNKYGGQAYDFKVQSFHGEDHLTFWLGDDTVRGHGNGHYYVLNSSYDVVEKVGTGNDLLADLHDFVITPDGTALMTAYVPEVGDTRRFGRKTKDVWNQAFFDGVFQEINIESGEVIFEWHASQYRNMSSGYHKITSIGDYGTRQNPFDWFHINSVQKDELGNYLVSARNTHSIYYVDGKTGEVIWTLGGKLNTFQDISGGMVLAFAWQHDARFVPLDAFPETYVPPVSTEGVVTRLMTLFDNAAFDNDHSFGMPYSRGLLIELSYPASPFDSSLNSPISATPPPIQTDSLSKTDQAKILNIQGTNSAFKVRLIREYINPHHIRSGTQGCLQLLPSNPGRDPIILIGYGINAALTQFSGNGTPICDIHYGSMTSFNKGDVQSYRAYAFPWTGRPRDPPAVKIRWGKLYVSWNGATDVEQWIVAASNTPEDEKSWEQGARKYKTGFETVIPLVMETHQLHQRYFRVVALGKDNHLVENSVSEIVERGWFGTGLRASDIYDVPAWIFVFVFATSVLMLCSWRRMRRLTVSSVTTQGIRLTEIWQTRSVSSQNK